MRYPTSACPTNIHAITPAIGQAKTYLGCGASAIHITARHANGNIASLEKYITGIENHKPDFEKEELDLYTRYNDFIITSLRTMWGMSLTRLKTGFGEKLYDYCIHLATPHLQQHTLQQTNGFLKLTGQGIFHIRRNHERPCFG